MKKSFLSLLFLFVSLFVYAQECTTTWPYLYSDFSEGKVYYKSGNTESKFMNIYILGNKLHFIEGENIVELKSANNIAKIEILKERYLPFEEKFYQIISEGDQGGYLALLATGDLTALQDNSGAYGSSSNSMSTNSLSSLEFVIGRSILTGNISHMQIRNNKDSGKSIPLLKKYFFITGGNVLAAKAKDVENSLPDAQKKKEFKTFVKANKIKWNNPTDLAKLLAIL